MDTASEVLVIIVSVTLAIFLILASVATVKLIQILNHVKHITEKGEKLADTAEAVGHFFQVSAGPAALAKLVANIAHSFTTKKRKGD